MKFDDKSLCSIILRIDPQRWRKKIVPKPSWKETVYTAYDDQFHFAVHDNYMWANSNRHYYITIRGAEDQDITVYKIGGQLAEEVFHSIENNYKKLAPVRKRRLEEGLQAYASKKHI